MLRDMRKSLFIACLAVVGCGKNPGMNQDPDPDAPVTTNPDAPPIPDGYTRLIGRTWTIASHSFDDYKCVRVTVPADMYVTDILAQAPTGTHHTVMSFAGGQVAGPDGEEDCSVMAIGTQMLFASGVGTDSLKFPDGVGLKISKGQQLHLNLHLYNGSDDPLSGDSAILVKSQSTPPAQIAEMVLAGSFLVNIPSNGTPTNVNGTCTQDRTASLFAVWPHMHQIATHQKVTLTHGGTTTTLHDLAYDFKEQKYWLQDPLVQLAAGDRINVTCTYVNNTGTTITWGDGSDKEMCFTGLYRYPASNSGYVCTN